jgi:hypothetical protein
MPDHQSRILGGLERMGEILDVDNAQVLCQLAGLPKLIDAENVDGVCPQ